MHLFLSIFPSLSPQWCSMSFNRYRTAIAPMSRAEKRMPRRNCTIQNLQYAGNTMKKKNQQQQFFFHKFWFLFRSFLSICSLILVLRIIVEFRLHFTLCWSVNSNLSHSFSYLWCVSVERLQLFSDILSHFFLR